MSKTEGEWKVKTLGEHRVSKGVVWRAQRSKAPDGKVFLGVRKYIQKADGTEIADRSGISMLEADAPALLPEIRKLFAALVPDAKIDLKSEDSSPKPKPKKGAHYILVNADAGVWNGKAFVDDLDAASRYTEGEAANALASLKRADRKTATVHDLRDTFWIRNVSGKYMSRVVDGEPKTGKTPQVFPTRIHALIVWRELENNGRWKIVTKDDE